MITCLARACPSCTSNVAWKGGGGDDDVVSFCFVSFRFVPVHSFGFGSVLFPGVSFLFVLCFGFFFRRLVPCTSIQYGFPFHWVVRFMFHFQFYSMFVLFRCCFLFVSRIAS